MTEPSTDLAIASAGSVDQPGTTARPALVLVVAHTRNRVIGRDNGMPWHLPADLRQFRALTTGHPILMGRRTHAAIGRVLPGRRNLVLSRTLQSLPGVECVPSVDAALAACAGLPLLFVIGGAEVYAQTLAGADRLHVTEIAADLEGDAWFPALDAGAWHETARIHRPADADNAYALDFVTLERVQP